MSLSEIAPGLCRVPPDSEHWISESEMAIDRLGTAGRNKWPSRVNDRVLPFFEEHEIALSRVLTDRGTEYCLTDSVAVGRAQLGQ
jgi:hypothetical protein